jgi:tRNA (guanine-N7-)-methyltransferase
MGAGMRRFDDRARHELRSFGRKRGRKLSARQEGLLREVLPRVSLGIEAPAPDPLTTLFAPPSVDVWLEIGFGGGEHMIWQASRHPEIGIIGCEPFEEGIVKALSALAESGHQNVRVYTDDARPVLRWLPPASIGRAFILFPDPWPKKRHAKRRLLSRALLDLLARVLRSGAELRVATDIGGYARTTLMCFKDDARFCWVAASPDDWRQRGPDWPETRYERKAAQDGRRAYFLRFIRK